MELEFHQLDRRYDALRVRQPARERRLLASLADVGQQMPIVVVTTESRYVVVDGHKRVRCLHRLHRDTVAALVWEMAACDALIFRHLLQTDATENVFEQAWLLRTLCEEHGLALDVVARRFDRSVSWVSRRLSLVRTLSDTVQQHVREGRIVAHAAMKYLVPLARANDEDGVRFADAIAPHRLTTRQIGRLYQHYSGGPAATRALILSDPLLVLRLTDDTPPAPVRPEASAPEALPERPARPRRRRRRAARRLQHGGACCRSSVSAPGGSSTRCNWTFAICSDAVRRSCAMLNQGLRTAILSLQVKGHGIRHIARALQISRGTVRS